MSDYQDSFKKLATRGTPLGAMALIEDVEAQIHRPETGSAAPRRRRLRGLAVAATAFVVVLASGLALGWFRTPNDFVIGDDNPIEWTEVEPNEFFFPRVVVGPGGFLRTSHRIGPDVGGWALSADGRTWQNVSIPVVGTGFSFAVGLATTEERWFLVLADKNEDLTAWTSIDGLNWERSDWPSELATTFDDVYGSASGFVAQSSDPFDTGPGLWSSTDGNTWVRLADTFPAGAHRGTLEVTAGGFIAVSERQNFAEPISVYVSQNGTTWTEGKIVLPPEFDEPPVRFWPGTIEYVGGLWIAVGEINRASADPVLYSWTSSDGASWVPQGIVTIGVSDGRALTLGEVTVIGDYLAAATSLVPIETYEGVRQAAGAVISTGEIWISRDGKVWEPTLRSDQEIDTFAGRVTESGSVIGIWISHPPQSIDSPNDTPVETTMAIQPDPQELDPAGLTLQDQILEDGTVTLQEYEQALEGWQLCMEDRGLFAEFELNARGTLTSRSYGGSDDPSGALEEPVMAACETSYLRQVEEGINRQSQSPSTSP